MDKNSDHGARGADDPGRDRARASVALAEDVADREHAADAEVFALVGRRQSEGRRKSEGEAGPGRSGAADAGYQSVDGDGVPVDAVQFSCECEL